MTITLRPARADDRDALAALGRETFLATFPGLYGEADLAAFLEEAYAPAAIAAELASPKRKYCVAEDSGSLVGYCKIALEVTLDYDPGDATLIELKQLYLSKPAQGQRLGDRFMDWAVEEARQFGAAAILLSVFSENYQAQRFYQRHGFVHVADTVFLVGEQADHEFLYLKKLK